MKLGRRYDSFLIRYWRLEGDERRVAIEHVQSGITARLPSLAAAIAWIEARHDERPDASNMAAAHEHDRGPGFAQFGRREEDASLTWSNLEPDDVSPHDNNGEGER
jgi:hypothetical protein